VLSVAADNDPIERKVQLTGGSTYTVSLPKDWAATQGIESGSTVQLYSRGRQLVLADGTDGEGRRQGRIDVGGRTAEELARNVAAAYVAGAEEIEIVGGPETEHRRAIRDAVAGLVGIEIHEETADRIVARTMLDIGDLSAEQTLVQMELTALSMQEDALTALETGNGEDARRVIRQDDDVDRLFRLICREFHRSLVDISVSRDLGRLTTFDYYTAARQIERVADHAEKIASVADRGTTPPPADIGDELHTLGEESQAIVQRAVSGLLEGEPEELDAAIAAADRVVRSADNLDQRIHEADVADGYHLGTVVDSLRRTAEYGANLAEAGLQAAMRGRSDS